LLESVYEEVLAYELAKRNVLVERQVEIPVVYDSIKLGTGFIADIVVEDTIILELKSVEVLKDVHKKQLLTYLKLSNKKLGLLLNFNVNLMKDGIVRIVNNV
jgi:GxxExxY protein